MCDLGSYGEDSVRWQATSFWNAPETCHESVKCLFSRRPDLVLRFHFHEWRFGAAFSIVGASCFGLAMAPPERPMPMKAHIDGAVGQQMGDKHSQFLHADGDQKRRFEHAAGLEAA